MYFFLRKNTATVADPEECSHDDNTDHCDFNRVDSKRFSKRFVKKSTSGKQKGTLTFAIFSLVQKNDIESPKSKVYLLYFKK